MKKGKELITIQDPMASMKSYFDVEPAVLSGFLKHHGKPVAGPLPKTKEQIETLVARFCDVKELEYLNEGKLTKFPNRLVDRLFYIIFNLNIQS
jgi:hypothetical protein